MGNQLRGEGYSKKLSSAAGTNAGATATLTPGSTGKVVVTHISASGDAAALVTIESPASTVLWRKRFAGAFTVSENFHFGDVEGAFGAAVLVKISASTANCEANIAGVEVTQ